MKKILPVLLAIAIVGSVVTSAYAYTTTHYEYKKCSGGTPLTAQTQATNGCVAYCAGLSASCCTTIVNNFGQSYQCTPYSNTSSVVNQVDTCQGPNPDTCTDKHYMADVISYSAQTDLAAGGVTPTYATAGISVTLSATVSNIGGATTGAGFTNLFQRATDASGTNTTDIGTHSAAALAASGNTTATLSYTFPSAATWYVRACADKSSAANTGTISESNEGNNCGSWTAVTVAANVPDLTAGSAGPTTATVNVSVTLSAVITNGGTAATGAGFTNLFQRATSAAGANTTDIGTHSAAALATGANTTATLSYAFPSAGTWYIRACADKNSAASSGTITEFSEANNCGSWTQVTVSNPVPTASISASPTVIYGGQSTTLTWSSTNAGSCIGSNFNTYNATSGSVSVSPTIGTTYMITCDGVSSSVYVDASSGPPNTGTYSVSQISSQRGGNTCGTDVNGGSGTVVTGGFYAGGGLGGYNSNTFPANFFNYPNRFCYEETETWVNNGTDTANQWRWYVYSATYVSNTSLPTLYPTAYPGKNNIRENYSFSVIPAPTASLSVSPTSVVQGTSATLTWSSTNATACTGTNFSTGNATLGSVSVSPSMSTTYTVSCSNTGGTAADTETLTVTAATIDFTSGVPSVNSGTLVHGTGVTFRANVTNGGSANTAATFSNRFQIDLSNNGSWDTNLDATNSITALNAGQTKQAASPSWNAVSGTHAIRLCADTPGTVTEVNEGNNCGSSWVFTVSAPPNAPTITGPTTGYTNTSYMFSFQAADPGGNTVRYGVDWDNNDVIDAYLPASGYVASGLYQDAYRTWTTTGAKTFKALTQNSLGANSGWTSHTITISDPPPPPPVAVLTASPGSVSGGGSSTLTWSSSNATTCTGTGFATGGATAGSVSTGALYTTQTYSVSCTGASGTDTDSTTVTVTSTIDLTAGTPGLDSGSLYHGGVVTFWANVTNVGDQSTGATFSNRFQIDLNDNGSWDVILDATNSISGLAVGQTKQVVSPTWSATQGSHRIRLCADAPASSVPESNESNNCSVGTMSFSVTAAPECADGIDNNGNGLTDYPADLACSGSLDGSEEVLPTAALTLAATPSGSLAVEGFIPEGTAATLAWAVADVIDGSCTLEGTNGDSWTLAGTSGVQVSSPLTAFTTFTLTCLDLNSASVSLTAVVRITPTYEEL